MDQTNLKVTALAQWTQWGIPLIAVGSIIVLIILVILLKKKFKGLGIQNPNADKPLNEKQMVEDNLNKILVQVDDDKFIKKEDEDKKIEDGNTEDSSKPQ